MKISRSLVSTACAALLVFGVAGCGSGDETATTTTITAPRDGDTNTTAPGVTSEQNASVVTVEAENIQFEPKVVTVPVGTTVRWLNKDSVLHTVTSGADRKPDGKFDGTLARAGDEFTYTFTEPGTYEYYCKPHLNMNGTVVVTA